MIFNYSSKQPDIMGKHILGKHEIEIVRRIRYLGYLIVDTLRNSDDIDSRRKKFYIEFNQIIRKFSNVNNESKLFLFKQYCLQIYGAELWFGSAGSRGNLKQYAIAYHKGIKKILGMSYRESNHYACQEAGVFTFENLINDIKIQFMLRLFLKPCKFIEKLWPYLLISSVLFDEMDTILKGKYNIWDIFDNDKDAVRSRIMFVQNHEIPMRGNNGV